MDQGRIAGTRAAAAGRRSLLGAAALTLLLAGCGSSGQPQQSGTLSTPPPSSSVASSATAGSLSASALPSGAPTTLQGTVTEGVENGCVVLVDPSGAAVANLQGWDLRAHPFGSDVEVTGTFESDMMTTCQQGTPFEVTAVVGK